MPRTPVLAAAFALFVVAAAANAQPVEVKPLAAPDAFSTAARETGLPQDLWRGASADTARAVLPLLAARPLSPAGQALARRVLATGAPGPQGAGADPGLAGARAGALLAQGDPKAAAAVLARPPGLDRSPELSRATAESALLAGDDARACGVADGLTAGRDEVYWLRLRTYCQAIAGRTDQAQLTFDLAQAQAKDTVFARLMGAKLAGVGAPGAPSLRNGLDYALSRNLGLDLAQAKPAPAVAAALSAGDPAPPVWDLPPGDGGLAAVMRAVAAGTPPAPETVERLIDQAAESKGKAQAATLLLAGLAGPLSPQARGRLAAFTVAEGKAPVARNLALEEAGQQKLMGQAALLALWTSAEAGAAGPAIGDRVRIVRALHAAGLDADARNYALEGLAGLK